MYTKRESRIINGAFGEALKSGIQQQHGAIITKSSKIIVRGYNQNRTTFLNKKRLCVHAEMDVVQQLIKKYFHRNSMKPDKRFRKYIVWVIRLGGEDKNGCPSLRGSSPCGDCLRLLNHLGFRKIGYSDDDGNIKIDTISNLINNSEDYFSTAHRYFRKISSHYI